MIIASLNISVPKPIKMCNFFHFKAKTSCSSGLGTHFGPHIRVPRVRNGFETDRHRVCSVIIASPNISVPKPIKMCIFFTLKQKNHVIAGSKHSLDLRFMFSETEIGLEPILNALAIFLLTSFASCSPNRKYDAYATFSARHSRFWVTPRD